MFTQQTKEQGMGIVEAIIVISIITVSFASLMGAAVFFFRAGLYAADQVQAIFLLDESAEAVRFLRDESFTTNIAPFVGTGPQHLDVDATGWTITATSTPIDNIYTRTIEITEVYRKDSDDTIVSVAAADPKTLDPGTVQLTSTVTWKSNSISAVTYVADIYEN